MTIKKKIEDIEHEILALIYLLRCDAYLVEVWRDAGGVLQAGLQGLTLSCFPSNSDDETYSTFLIIILIYIRLNFFCIYR